MATTSVQMPQELIDAIEEGELSDEQFLQLITVEAAMIGLTFDEAVAGARDNTLPWNAVGMELRDLIKLLDHSPVATPAK